MFRCSFCPKMFAIQGSLMYHIVSHTKEKPHECRTCSATFGLLSNLTRHEETVHSIRTKNIQIQNWDCHLCSYKSNHSTKLKAHMRKHSTDASLPCKVPSCSFKTKFPKGLKKHFRRVHLREAPYVCQAVGCNYKTSEKENLKRHLKIHSNERLFACQVPACNYTCKTKDYLTTHSNCVHSDEKPWKCSVCGFRTKLRSNLNKHQVAHNGIKIFQCQASNCRFASKNKQSLVKHFDYKHRKKEILCTEPRCNYRCGSTALLKTHLNKHKLPILKCPNSSCNFSAKLKTALLDHISRRHGSKQNALIMVSRKSDPANVGQTVPRETRHCPFPNCDYQTEFPHRFDRHMVTHDKEEELKFPCKFCPARYAKFIALEDHIKRHVGEKPYSCSQCGFTTANGGSLRSHARNVHDIFVIPRGNENKYERECRICILTSTSYSEFVLHSMTHLNAVVKLERLRVQVV